MFLSGINALAANTVEDFFGRPLKKVSERTATFVTKVAATVHGILICCLAYVAQYLDGSVIQISLTVFGCLGTPVLGMFLIGCTVPWANKYGALAGGILSLAFNLWISIGHQFYGRKIPSLSPPSIENCSYLNPTTNNNLTNASSSDGETLDQMLYHVVNNTLNESADSNGHGFFLYDVSFEWYSFYGLVSCIIVGLAVSFVTRDKKWKQTSFNTSLMFPLCTRFWNLESAEQSNELCNDTENIDVECKVYA